MKQKEAYVGCFYFTHKIYYIFFENRCQDYVKKYCFYTWQSLKSGIFYYFVYKLLLSK